MSRPQRILAALTCPSPFTLHSAAHHPSFGRSSPLILAPFTPALHCAALHSAGYHLSFSRSSRLTPARHSRPSLPPFTAAPFTLHSAAPYPSRPHPSLLLFTTPPFTLHPVALHCGPTLHRPSLPPFTLPHFTFHFNPHSYTLHLRPSLRLHHAALHPSLPHPSLPTTAPALHSAAFHPSFRRYSLFTRSPFIPALHSAAHHCRPPLCRPAHFIPPSIILHSRTLHMRPSLHRPSFPPFTLPPFTLHSAAVHSAVLHSRPFLRRSSLPPFIPPHGQPPLVELRLLQLGENSYAGSSPCGPATPLREATNPSTERRTATSNLLFVEQNSYRSPPHSVTYIRHPSSY
jgi:hypothetical protein